MLRLYLTQLVTPLEATEDVLRDVHTPVYLREIKTSKQKVAQAGLAFAIYTFELPPGCFLCVGQLSNHVRWLHAFLPQLQVRLKLSMA